ncbi:hypothetical protein GQ42DRAFT_161518 [Ramicandelaber brevisporus]|nr:hypothetical protein GQ42DRAFT_161518 [Ramicandelaber brevisporus]
MTKTLQGTISAEGHAIGNFPTDQGHIVAHVYQLVKVALRFEKTPATLEYEDIADLKGEFKIDEGSVIGPKELRLSLTSESGKKAKITAKFESETMRLPPIGTVSFENVEE